MTRLRHRMNTTIKICLTGAAAIGISVFSTLATPIKPINITLSLPLDASSVLVNDVNANGLASTGGDLGWIDKDVHWYDHDFGGSLIAPSSQNGISEKLNGTISVAAGDYLVLVYSSGGNRVSDAMALYFSASGNYNISKGVNGPNGGVLSAELFAPSKIPDGGATALLLGSALSAIALIRRKLS